MSAVESSSRPADSKELVLVPRGRSPPCLYQPQPSSVATGSAASSTNTTSPREPEFAHPSGFANARALILRGPGHAEASAFDADALLRERAAR